MRIISGLFAMLCLNGLVFSKQHWPDLLPDPNLRPYVITISAGPAWTSAGENQNYLLQPNVRNAYIANRNTSSLGVGEFFLGWQSRLGHTYYGQVGIEVAGSSMAKLSGNIWAFADPEFNNFNYTYDVNQFRLSLKGKLITQEPVTRLCVLPYITGGVGLGFNRAYNYNVTSKLYEEIPGPNFRDNTITNYAATMGIGLQKNLKKHWQAGVGYEFADWGESQLGRAPGQTLNAGIMLMHLYAHALLFNVTYVE